MNGRKFLSVAVVVALVIWWGRHHDEPKLLVKGEPIAGVLEKHGRRDWWNGDAK